MRDEIDVDNFIDYMIFQSYIGNRDWPQNNVRFFAIEDGPFRFVLFDLDLVATIDLKHTSLWFIEEPYMDNPISDLFKIMYTDTDFKNRYDDRYDYLLSSEVLSFPKFETIVDHYKDNIHDLMPIQIDKYGDPGTVTEWYLELDALKNNFLDRENYVR